MAKTVAILGRTYLPGGGYNTSGSPKQGKTQTWGTITITTYTSGGEPLVPNDVGLTRIDYLEANVDQADGAAIGSNIESSAVYRYTAQTIVVFEAAADVADTSAVLRFVAIGDSASDVESLA